MRDQRRLRCTTSRRWGGVVDGLPGPLRAGAPGVERSPLIVRVQVRGGQSGSNGGQGVRVYIGPREKLEPVKREANVRTMDSQPVVLGNENSWPAPAPATSWTGSTKHRGVNFIPK